MDAYRSDGGEPVAGVELGGTKCIAVLASGREVLDEARFPTTTPAETLGALSTVLRRWRDERGVAALGVASFGPLELDERSEDFGRLVTTPKPGWSGADLTALSRELDAPMAIDTDVNGAALAEGRWGAAQGLRSYAYVTVGTGVGVGSIVDGRSIQGLGHSEAGHLRIGRRAGDGFAGICPYHGDCVEGLASGPALAARAGRPGETLTEDDPAWDGVAHALGALLHNLALTTAPERVLIGGGLGGRPHLLAKVRRALIESLAGYATGDRIAAGIETYVQAPGLGDRAGPLGAVALALDAWRRAEP